MLTADRMMQKLYDRIRPTGTRHDGSRQFPKDYDSLHRLLKVADQLINHTEWISEASQRLLYRLLMDAPVDEDTEVMFRMLDLLDDPRYLDDDSILRLYETAAYHCSLSMARISLNGLDVTTCQLQFVGNTGVAETVEHDRRQIILLDQILHSLTNIGTEATRCPKFLDF